MPDLRVVVQVTTINIKVRNPATKKDAIVARFKGTYKRKHGRPRNVGRRHKVRRLPLPLHEVGPERTHYEP